MERGREGGDVVGSRVDEEARASGPGHPEPPHERLGTVMAGPDSNAILIKRCGEIMWVNAAAVKGDQWDPLVCFGRSIDGDTIQL